MRRAGPSGDSRMCGRWRTRSCSTSTIASEAAGIDRGAPGHCQDRADVSRGCAARPAATKHWRSNWRGLHQVGSVQGNPLQTNLGDSAGAMTSFARADELLTPLAASGDPAARRELMTVAYRTATMHQAGGNLTAAAQAFARATDLGERLVAEAPATPNRCGCSARSTPRGRERRRPGVITRRWPTTRCTPCSSPSAWSSSIQRIGPSRALSTAHNAVGAARLAAGELEPAAEAFRAAVAIRQRLVESQPGDADSGAA